MVVVASVSLAVAARGVLRIHSYIAGRIASSRSDASCVFVDVAAGTTSARKFLAETVARSAASFARLFPSLMAKLPRMYRHRCSLPTKST